MYHTTGLTREQLMDLVAAIDQFLKKKDNKAGRPPVIGLFKSVVALLWYLRRNRAQAEIAELLGVSQSTVSRRITALTPVLEEVLARVHAGVAAEQVDGVHGAPHRTTSQSTVDACVSWQASSAQPEPPRGGTTTARQLRHGFWCGRTCGSVLAVH
jgi:hypothetical protein